MFVTLTIHQEEDEQRQLKLTVEVEESRVQKQMDQFIRRFSREAQIPGFRRGKVPRNVIVKRFGEETLRAETVEEMLESLVEEIFEEVNVEEVAHYQPMMDEMELNPLVLKFIIPLEPKVTLGDYRTIRKELDPIEVTDERLEDALDHVRGHHQVLEEVDRPSEAGDVVTVTGTGWTIEDEEEFWHVHDNDLLLDSETAFPDIPIVENIIGMSAGEEKEISFTFPEDYEEEELAGKEAKVNVEVSKVQSRFLPEIDEELVKKEGDFESVEAFMEDLKVQLHEAAERQAKTDLMDFVIDEMLEDVEMVYPPAAIEAELSNLETNMITQLKQYGWEGDSLGADFRIDSREQAEANVRRGLTLRQFMLEEKIKVRDSDIDEALEDRLEKFADNEELREQLRSIFMQGKSFETMQQNIIEEKIYERMKAIVTGNAPDLASLEEEDEATTEDEEE
jgi:trigger factor